MFQLFKKKLNRFVSDNPILYKLYFYIIRKRKGLKPTFFTATTDYYFDAYPRSGNTYFAHLALRIFPDKEAVHHLHKIAPIKIALQKKLSVLILFREPTECISSNYLKHYSMRHKDLPASININLLKIMVDEYSSYYKYVLKNNNKITLISFKNFINNPSFSIYTLSKILGYNFSRNYISEEVQKHKKTYKGATTKYGSSKPNEFKEIKKKEIKEELCKISGIKDCINIYNELLKFHDNID